MNPLQGPRAGREQFHQWAWNRCLDLESAAPHLSYLFWEATRRCNLACRHCASACDGTTDRPDELAGDEVLAALSGVARDFGAANVFLAVTGGEPLVRPDLFEVMGGARDLGFAWGLVTNGWAVDDRVVEDSRRAGLQNLVVSLDGAGAASHDRLRGEGSFGRALAAVDRYRQAGFLRGLQVATAINAQNLPELQQMYDLLVEHGVRDWRIVSVFPGGRARGEPGLLLAPGGLAALLDFIGAKRSRPGPLKVTYGDEGFLGEPHEGRVRDHRFACLAGVRVASILADGTVTGCPNVPRVLAQGNVRRQSVKEAWETGFQPFRDRGWMRRGPCEACDDFGACRGNSLHLWDPEAGRTAMCHRDLLRQAAAAGEGAT